MKLAILAVLLITMLAIAPVLAVEYTLHDLGYGEAFGINDLGYFTGWRKVAGSDRAFIWSASTGFVDILNIGFFGTGRDINNVREVAGDGWIWSQNKGLIPLVRPDGSEGTASCAINNSGEIVGWERYNGYEAVLWSDSQTRNVLTSGWAYDINNHATVVGEFQPSSGEDHAFMWSQSGGLVDIGDFGTIYARADGINDQDQVVGTYHPGDNVRGYLWSQSGGLIDLGTLGGYHSYAFRISNNAQVVGCSMFQPGNATVHAFIWDASSGMIDLGGGTSSKALDINDMGQIIGTFRDDENKEHIALWTPVPEPLGMLALGAGLFALIGIGRKKKKGEEKQC